MTDTLPEKIINPEESWSEYLPRAASYVFKKVAVASVGVVAVLGAMNTFLKKPVEVITKSFGELAKDIAPKSLTSKLPADAYEKVGYEAGTNAVEAIVSALVVGGALFTGWLKFGQPPIRGVQ